MKPGRIKPVALKLIGSQRPLDSDLVLLSMAKRALRAMKPGSKKTVYAAPAPCQRVICTAARGAGAAPDSVTLMRSPPLGLMLAFPKTTGLLSHVFFSKDIFLTAVSPKHSLVLPDGVTPISGTSTRLNNTLASRFSIMNSDWSKVMFADSVPPRFVLLAPSSEGVVAERIIDLPTAGGSQRVIANAAAGHVVHAYEDGGAYNISWISLAEMVAGDEPHTRTIPAFDTYTWSDDGTIYANGIRLHLRATNDENVSYSSSSVPVTPDWPCSDAYYSQQTTITTGAGAQLHTEEDLVADYPNGTYIAVIAYMDQSTYANKWAYIVTSEYREYFYEQRITQNCGGSIPSVRHPGDVYSLDYTVESVVGGVVVGTSTYHREYVGWYTTTGHYISIINNLVRCNSYGDYVMMRSQHAESWVLGGPPQVTLDVPLHYTAHFRDGVAFDLPDTYNLAMVALSDEEKETGTLGHYYIKNSYQYVSLDTGVTYPAPSAETAEPCWTDWPSTVLFGYATSELAPTHTVRVIKPT